MSIDRIQELLVRRIGMDPESLGNAAIERSIRRCMKAANVEDAAAYYRLICADDGRFDELVETVVVGETWFFRQPDSFTCLADRVKKELLRFTPEKKLNILSIGCSSGEEPYAIAMTLLDMGLKSECFRIDASDISSHALAAARRGKYRASSFQGAALKFRDRWFTTEQDEYVLDPNVLETVNFIRSNVLSEHFMPGGLKYDAIFCRHVLIYLTVDARALLVKSLSERLASSGIVFVGSSEMMDIRRRGFRSTGSHSAFACEPVGDEETRHAAPRTTFSRTTTRVTPPAGPTGSGMPRRTGWPRLKQNIQPLREHESVAPSPDKAQCWRISGTSGDSSCPLVSVHTNCRNCPTYGAYGRTFLDRVPPDGYIDSWQALISRPFTKDDRSEYRPVVIFRLGEKLFAFQAALVTDIAPIRNIHRIPHRSNKALLGLSNFSGDLRLCVSLHALLGESEDNANAASGRRVYRRMITVGRAGANWAFPADEVFGVHLVRFDDSSAKKAAAAAMPEYAAARFPWNDRSVTCLDEDLLFPALERSIR